MKEVYRPKPTPEIMPRGWEDNPAVKYLDSPFSAESLADPNREFLEVGKIDLGMASLPISYDLVESQHELKPAGDAAVVFWDSELFPSIVGAHKRFLDAACTIMGPKAFTDVKVMVTYHQSGVPKGTPQRLSDPHLDGYPQKNNATLPQAKLIGVLYDQLPMMIVKDPVAPADFDGVILRRVLGKPFNVKDLNTAAVPTNTIAVMSPGIAHFGQNAPERIDNRRFTRWTVIDR